MDSLPVPLWSVGVVLLLVGPIVVQKLAEVWTAAVERRTDEALSAMTARPKGTDPNLATEEREHTPDELAHDGEDTKLSQ